MNVVKIVSIFGACMAVGIVLAGCGASESYSKGDTNDTPQALVGHPAKGQQLFQQYCANCHSTGTDTIFGPGLKGLFSKSALPNGQPMTDANVEEWIKTGGGNMPSFMQLSNQDRADLVAYLKTLK